ncbi:MAG: adenylosuccinate lyase family protein [Desulfobulbaceae bacterium]|nr:adenylosuccinate lyase family protein [Desulfobulbaceae bacterium]
MTTCDLNSHIIDSGFYSNGYATSEARTIFCDIYRYQRWLDVEAALAVSQAELGIIPQWAADIIAEKAQLKNLDLNAIREGIQKSCHSLIPLLEALRKVCPKDAGQFIHFGATTQDIQDTAQSLEMKDVLDIVERDLLLIINSVSSLAEKFKDTVTIGRTHAQHALPMTLGLKMAVWLDELWRNYERLEPLRERLLVSQLFGGVGTMDAFSDQGITLLTKFSEKLGLTAPNTAWHASRDRTAEFLSVLAMISGTNARIANEIRCLSRNEIGEMEEPFQMGKIGSSTMPHKRNPEMCEQVIVLARLIKSNALLGFEGMINEHERDYRAVRMEWITITDSAHFICGQLALMTAIMKGLIVYENIIHKNVEDAATFISTEALMFYLGTKIGKQTAHHVVYEVCMEAIETKKLVIDLLLKRPEIAGNFEREELLDTIDPVHHIGLSAELTDLTVKSVSDKVKQLTPVFDLERLCPLKDSTGICEVKR